jgi:hypothetical protein
MGLDVHRRKEEDRGMAFLLVRCMHLFTIFIASMSCSGINEWMGILYVGER